MARPADPEASTYERILRCARDLYLDQGLAGLSMRGVARCAGISAPAIYRHFQDKEALLSAVAEGGFHLFGEYLWRGLQGETALDRLKATGAGYLAFGLEHRRLYRFMFMTMAKELGWEGMPEATQQKAAPTFQFLVDRVRGCIEEGTLVDEEPQQLAATIWAHTHGLVSLYLTGHLRRSAPEDEAFAAFYRHSVDGLLRGLAP